MITLVIYLIIGLILVYLADLFLAAMQVPDPPRRIVLALVALVILLYVLQRAGLFNGLGL